MSRFEAERRRDLDEVFNWYELQLFLLNQEDKRLPELLLTDVIPDAYRDKSLDELREQFVVAGKHLRYSAMLHLLTTAEALLPLSFADLANRRTKPEIFRRFRKIQRERGERIRIEEDILDVWGGGVSGDEPLHPPVQGRRETARLACPLALLASKDRPALLRCWRRL